MRAGLIVSKRQAGLALNALKWTTPAQVGAYMQASQVALGDTRVDDYGITPPSPTSRSTLSSIGWSC